VALAKTAAALTQDSGWFGRRRRRYGCSDESILCGGRFHFRLDGRRNILEWMGAHSSVSPLSNKHDDERNADKKPRPRLHRLDQSGGSTPKALMGYGYRATNGLATRDVRPFTRCADHQVAQLGVGKVIGAILFERTMDGTVDGTYCRKLDRQGHRAVHQDDKASRTRKTASR
jgi:hypothetical protein